MNTRSTDHSGMEILDSGECLRLLDGAPMGRVAYVADGSPRIFPVTHRLAGQRIVFMSAFGSKLDAAEMGRSVAFEIDGWDPAHRSGWSVVATGRAHAVTDQARLDELEELGLDPWLAGQDMGWIEITIEELSGRRLPT